MAAWFKVRSVADRLLVLRVRIPPGAWMFFSCECYLVLQGVLSGVADRPITCPGESYRVGVIMCDRMNL